MRRYGFRKMKMNRANPAPPIPKGVGAGVRHPGLNVEAMQAARDRQTEKTAYGIIATVGVLLLGVFVIFFLNKPDRDLEAEKVYQEAEELIKKGDKAQALVRFKQVDPLAIKWHKKARARVEFLEEERRTAQLSAARATLEQIESDARESSVDLKALRERYRVFIDTYEDTPQAAVARDRILEIDRQLKPPAGGSKVPAPPGGGPAK
ncbi:MAG: hypothetical protein V1809_10920 [Planctomycetota bacterium]